MTVPMTWATPADVYEHIDKRDALDALAEEADEPAVDREARLINLLTGMKGRMLVSLRRRYHVPLLWPSSMNADLRAAEQEALRDIQVELVIEHIWNRRGKEPEAIRSAREKMDEKINDLGSLNATMVLSCLPSTGHFAVTKRPASDMAPHGQLPYLDEKTWA